MRKRPYEHDVGNHVRGGKRIEKYKRGKGKKPSKPKQTSIPSSGGNRFSVTLHYSGGSETYPVTTGTITAAIKAALSKLQRPVVPDKITWVRL